MKSVPQGAAQQLAGGCVRRHGIVDFCVAMSVVTCKLCKLCVTRQ
jgi:hypothetical protein